MQKFDVLVYSGYRYDFLMSLEAKNAKAARKAFKAMFAGDHRTEKFIVRKST